MSTDGNDWPCGDTTRRIIGCAYTVANALGTGFLEKIYENALALEMRAAGLAVEQQHALSVWYRDTVIGSHTADLLVEGRVLVELKAAKSIDDVHCAQCIHYLKATGLPVCLLLNFGTTKVQVKRFVL